MLRNPSEVHVGQTWVEYARGRIDSLDVSVDKGDLGSAVMSKVSVRVGGAPIADVVEFFHHWIFGTRWRLEIVDLSSVSKQSDLGWASKLRDDD